MSWWTRIRDGLKESAQDRLERAAVEAVVTGKLPDAKDLAREVVEGAVFDLATATLDQIDAENIRLGQQIDAIREQRLRLRARAVALREQRDARKED